MLSANMVGQTQGAEASKAFSEALSRQQLSQGSLTCSALPGIGRHAIGCRAEVPNKGDAHSNDAADTRPETCVEGVVVDLPCFLGRGHGNCQAGAPPLLSAQHF